MSRQVFQYKHWNNNMLFALLMRIHQGAWSIIMKWRSHIKHSKSEGHYFNINERPFLFPFSFSLSEFWVASKIVSTLKKSFLPWKLNCACKWKVISLSKKSYYCYILNNQWLSLSISSKVWGTIIVCWILRMTEVLLSWADPYCLF